MNSSNASAVADAVFQFTESIVGLTNASGVSVEVPISQFDAAASVLLGNSISQNSSNAFILATSPRQENNDLVLGAGFRSQVGGQVISDRNVGNILNSDVSVAAVFENSSLNEALSIAFVVIGDPRIYREIDRGNNRTLMSQIITADARFRATNDSRNITIKLFFEPLPDSEIEDNAEIRCSFFDSTDNSWNESGCTVPVFNRNSSRYECECYHLTSFALIWASGRGNSMSSGAPTLNAADIVSVILMSISIVCFIVLVAFLIIEHNVGSANKGSSSEFLSNPRFWMPLPAYGLTGLLFIFYIALTINVYQRYRDTPNMNMSAVRPLHETTSLTANFSSVTDSSSCIGTEKGLAFITYLLLLLMLSFKTLCGFLSFEHYAKNEFPVTGWKLVSCLLIAILIPIGFVVAAIGFNSNPSNQILIIIGKKLCWFSSSVIHFFLTIPVSAALFMNIIFLIRIVYGICQFRRSAGNVALITRKQYYKQLSLVIIFSLFVQGIGWIFGPLITVTSGQVSEVLQWFFIVSNGAEGFWILLIVWLTHKYRMANYSDGVVSTIPDQEENATDNKYKSKSFDKEDSLTKNNNHYVHPMKGSKSNMIDEDDVILSF